MTVTQKQCLLTFLGYNPGKIDGLDGKNTQAAMAAFKKDYGVGEDGLIGAVSGAVPKVRNDVSFWDGITYFKRNEFKCTCGGKYCNGFPVEPDKDMVRTMDKIRSHFGKPIHVNSSIRCAKRNAEVGGVSNSQHVLGKACDFGVSGVSPQKVAEYAETLLPAGGIGIYSWGVHIDTRAVKSRWRG